DAEGRAGRAGGDRQFHQRRAPRRRDAGDHGRRAGRQARRLPARLARADQVIPRYSLPEMAALFTDEARFQTWLDVEILAVEAWAAIGVILEVDAKELGERAPQVDGDFVTEVQEREAVTDHDVAAFVDVVQFRTGPPAGNWVHFGLTSSDVVDTALSLTLTRAAELLIAASGDLVSALKRRALEF